MRGLRLGAICSSSTSTPVANAAFRVSSRTGSEYLPTIWKNRVAFLRIYPNRRGRAGEYAHLYLHDLARETTRELRSPPRGVFTPFEPGGFFGGIQGRSMDLVGRRLAIAWHSYVRRCGRFTYPTAEGEYPDREELWLFDVDRRGRTLVDHSCRSEGLRDPTLLGPWLHYQDDYAADEPVSRYDLRTRRRQHVFPEAIGFIGLAGNRGGLYTVGETTTGPVVGVYRFGPLAFSNGEPPQAR